MRLLLPTLIICVLALSAQAQYSGGSGTADDPYQIATAADLIAVGETPDDYDKHFILTADIDLDPNLPGRKAFDRAVIAPGREAPFTGIFDGNGHVVLNLSIIGEDCIGLFGEFRGEVRSLGIVDATITGSGWSVGGLVGCMGGGWVTRCYSTGMVAGESRVGGLIGRNGVSAGMMGEVNAGFIDQCWSTASVKGSEEVGGLVGSSLGGEVRCSYATGSVTAGGIGVGGLVGHNVGSITSSHSTGAVTGRQLVGGLVGMNYRGSIALSYSTGGVSADCYDVGGLVGVNDRGSIALSYSTGTVNGDKWVGGLVGTNSSGALRESYSLGDVTGHRLVGGLIGMNLSSEEEEGGGTCTIINCYSASGVRGEEPVGGLVGGNDGETVVVITASFWDTQTSGQMTSDGGTGLTTSAMQTAGTFLEAGWDFVGETDNGPNDVWKIVEGQTYPLLSWQKYGGGTGEPNDPYLIYTAEHLNALGETPDDYDKHFKLMADIDLSGYTYDRAVIAPDTNDAVFPGHVNPFDGAPFTGVLDGNGHIVSHLTILGDSHLGLFGEVRYGAEISNLGLEAADVHGSKYVGGLVGYNKGGITMSYSNGAISGTDYVGGLLGWNTGTITGSYATGTITGWSCVGGLAGTNGECYLMSVFDGLLYCEPGTISNCYSAGRVDGDHDVGGLTGYNGGAVVHCYSSGTVNGRASIGGFLGDDGTTCDHWSEGVSGTVTNCLWDTEASGLTNMCGSQGDLPSFVGCSSGCDDGYGKTTAEMHSLSTYLDAGWDFIDETENGTDDIWWIDEGRDYPRLWWEPRN